MEGMAPQRRQGMGIRARTGRVGALMRHSEPIETRDQRPWPVLLASPPPLLSDLHDIMWHGGHVALRMETALWGLLQWPRWCCTSKMDSWMANGRGKADWGHSTEHLSSQVPPGTRDLG